MEIYKQGGFVEKFLVMIGIVNCIVAMVVIVAQIA